MFGLVDGTGRIHGLNNLNTVDSPSHSLSQILIFNQSINQHFSDYWLLALEEGETGNALAIKLAQKMFCCMKYEFVVHI